VSFPEEEVARRRKERIVVKTKVVKLL